MTRILSLGAGPKPSPYYVYTRTFGYLLDWRRLLHSFIGILGLILLYILATVLIFHQNFSRKPFISIFSFLFRFVFQKKK